MFVILALHIVAEALDPYLLLLRHLGQHPRDDALAEFHAGYHAAAAEQAIIPWAAISHPFPG